jgi:hypothetical protein
MGRKYRAVEILTVAGAVLLVASGCSKSSKKVTNADTLTKDQQYALTETYLDAMVPLMVGQFGARFWDGIGPEDFNLGSLSPLGVGKLASPLDSISYQYEVARGWWIIYAHVSVDNDTVGTLQFTLRDSVRFETQSGRAQVNPNDSTYRVRNGGNITLNLEAPFGDSASLSTDLTSSTTVDVTGLTGSVATVNGNTNAFFGFGLVSGANSADVGFDLQASIDNVTVSTSSSDPCPIGGSMAVNLGLNIDVVQDRKHDAASGQWEVQIGFASGGMANIDVHSGDFHAQKSVSVCE